MQGPVTLQHAVDVLYREDKMRWEGDTRMSPVSQPRRSLWHSLRRHRGKRESYIRLVLSQKQSLLPVGYSFRTTRTGSEHRRLHQRPEALPGFAPCGTTNARATARAVLRRPRQPLGCQKQHIPQDS